MINTPILNSPVIDPCEDTAKSPTLEEWTGAIHECFYAGRDNQPSYLALDQDALAEIGSRLGVEKDAEKLLVASVLEKCDFTVSNPFDWYEDHSSHWAESGFEGPPPHLPLISVFVLAASHMRIDEGHWSTNYYDRLMDTLDLDESTRGILARYFMKKSGYLFGLLNRWLVESRGRFGLPTAKAFDKRKHIGLAMSQILMRQVERDRLPEFFDWAGYEPRDIIPARDILYKFNKWIKRGGLSDSFATRWERMSIDARMGVARVIEVELTGWNGTHNFINNEASSTLKVMAVTSPPPFERIELSMLVTDARSEGEAGLFETRTEDISQSRAVHRIRVEKSGWVPGYLNVFEADLYDYASLLSQDVELWDIDGNQLRRNHSPVVTFKQDLETGFWVESAKVSLGETSMLLVQEGWLDDVEKFLAKVARPGFDVNQSMQDSPPGWSVITGVQVIGIGESGADGPLDRLIPNSTVKVSASGYMKMSPRDGWMARENCEIVAVAHGANEPRLYIENAARDFTREWDLKEAKVIDYASLDIDGDLLVTVTESARGRESTLLERRFPFVKPGLPAQDVVRRIHDLAAPAASVFSAVIDNFEIVSGLAGFKISSLPSNMERCVCKDQGIPTVSDPAAASYVYENPGSKSCKPRKIGSTRDEKIIGHRHHWMLPEQGPGLPPRYIDQKCKSCAKEKIGLGKINDSLPVNHVSGNREFLANVDQLKPLPMDSSSVNWNLLLGAISYIGNGKGRLLESLIGRCGAGARKFFRDIAMDLSSLGFIDLEWDSTLSEISGWSVCNPQIVMLATGKSGFLTGFRSEVLISSLEDVSRTLPVTVTYHDAVNMPRRVVFKGDFADISDIAKLAEEATGIEIQVVKQPAIDILSALPAVSAVVAELPVENSVDPCLLEPMEGYESSSSGGVGAYRDNREFARQAYVRTETGRYIPTNYRLAKMAASLVATEAKVLYDPVKQAMVVPLGARLFSLWERALVGLTGELPVKAFMRSRAYQVYSEVDPETAAIFWEKIGAK